MAWRHLPGAIGALELVFAFAGSSAIGGDEGAITSRDNSTSGDLEDPLGRIMEFIDYAAMTPSEQTTFRSLADVPDRGETGSAKWVTVGWSHWTGGGSRRYQDPEADRGDHKYRLQYIQEHSPLAIYESESRENIDRLSPFEKYDILVGDTGAGMGSAERDLSVPGRQRESGLDFPSPGFGLTKSMWLEIISQRQPKGTGDNVLSDNVDEWIGVCHGASIAAISVPRPTHAVEVLAADGKTRLTFFPEDIKALASYCYAETGTGDDVLKIGTRCPVEKFTGGDRFYEKIEELADGTREGEQGFKAPMYSPEALNRSYASGGGGRHARDVDPGAFHIALANVVGRRSGSFIVDIRSDDEVWNKIVHEYSFSYARPGSEPGSLEKGQRIQLVFLREELEGLLRPITGEPAPGMPRGAQSRVLVRADVAYKNKDSRTRFQLDPARNGGILANGYYLRAAPEDGENDDMKLHKRYFYELYLDSEGRIIAGAWFNHLHGGNDHPDFFWRPLKPTPATAFEERAALEANDWSDPTIGLPASFSAVAIENSRQEGRPLKILVDRLIAFSRERDR